MGLFDAVPPEWIEQFKKEWTETCNTVKSTGYPLGCVFIRPDKKPRSSVKRKQILAYDQDGNLVRTYNSISEASADLNVKKLSIVKACYGELRRVRGYSFCFKE